MLFDSYFFSFLLGLLVLDQACHIGHRQAEGDALGPLCQAHLLVNGIEDIVPDLLLHHHHQDLFVGMEGNTEERGSVLIHNTSRIEDRTAPDTLLPGHIHHILGIDGIDDGKYHFKIIGLHIIPSPCGYHLRIGTN